MDVEEGDRYEDSDPRQGDRVVRIIDVVGGIAEYEVETAGFNPSTVGRREHVTLETLHDRYRKISR